MGPIGEISSFYEMLQQGPEIARCADRVAVLRLASFVRAAPKTIIKSCIYSHSGHTVYLHSLATTQCAQKAQIGNKLFTAHPYVEK